MHFQKKFIKGIAIMLSALMLTISITNTNTIPVYAAGASAELTLTKVIDMALTKTGVIANNNWLQKVQASFLNMMNGTASSYSSYCEANGLEKNEETWNQYLSSDSYIGLGFAIPNFVLQSVWAIEWMLAPEQYAEEQKQMQAAVQALAETATCVQAETYKLKDEAVEFVRDTFDDIVAEDGLGYYYVPVYKPSDLPVSWFSDLNSFNNFKEYINSSDYITPFAFQLDSISQFLVIKFYSNESRFNYVMSNINSNCFIYHDDWTVGSCYLKEFRINQTNFTVPFNSVETLKLAEGASAVWPTEKYHGNEIYYDGTTNTTRLRLMFISCNGGKQIVYKSLTDFKNYNGGNKPLYHVTNSAYSTGNDNSISYTGDYIINNGQNYSYDTVQNTIDNSVDNSTDESVTTIVNDSYNTIINNYYYTSPDSGGDSGIGSDDDSSGGGLGALLDGIGSILDFVVTLIGDVIGLIGGFLDTVYDLLKNLGGNFANFSNLLGELFSFIPQELIDLIGAGIGVMIAVAVIRMIKG